MKSRDEEKMKLNPRNTKYATGVLYFFVGRTIPGGLFSKFCPRERSDYAGAEWKLCASTLWRASWREYCAANGSTALWIGDDRSIRTTTRRRYWSTSFAGDAIRTGLSGRATGG